MATASDSSVYIDETMTELADSKAQGIIEDGTAFDYIIEVWRNRHHGDLVIGKILLLSIGCQSILNSKGIHVQLTGAGGGGKTDTALQMIRLIDPKYVLDGTI